MPAHSTDRLLAVLVWIELVMCRPRLAPAADPRELVRHVETLAGHVADLLAREGAGLPPDNNVMMAARDVLDTCCRFIECWNRRTEHGTAFATDVGQLRTRLNEIARRLERDAADADAEPKAS